MIERIPAAGRIGFGALLVLAPGSLLRPLLGGAPSAGERAVARLLGARNLVEGAAVLRSPTRGWLAAAAAVDAAHAATMLLLAARSRRYRRAALASAAVASTAALTGAAGVRFGARLQCGHTEASQAAGGFADRGHGGPDPPPRTPSRSRIANLRPRLRGGPSAVAGSGPGPKADPRRGDGTFQGVR